MVVVYTFSVVVVVVVVVVVEGEDAGKREGGEAVVEAVGCERRGVGDGSEGVDVGERGGVVTVGEAVRGGRREVDGVEAGGEGEGGADGGKVVGRVAVVVEVGRRKVEVEEEVAGQDEAVSPGRLVVEWLTGWCSLAGLVATSGSAVAACLGWCSLAGLAATSGSAVACLAGSCNVESLGPWLTGELMSA